MGRLAIISDLHADVHALRDALVEIERLRCDAVVCAGDIIDYGRFPEETIALLRDCRIPTIRGNHDRSAVRENKADLSQRAITFLGCLPLAWGASIDGVRVAVHHGRPGSDLDGIDPNVTKADADALLEDGACDVLVVGHTHVAFERRVAEGRMVCNPGALLRDPTDRREVPARGTFGVLDLPSCTFRIHAAATGHVVRHRRDGGEVLRAAGPQGRERPPRTLPAPGTRVAS